MTVKFQSQATADLVMLDRHAHAVLQLIGKSEVGSGILEPKDMPAALTVFKNLPNEEDNPPAARAPEAVSGHGRNEGQDDEDEDTPERPQPAFINETVSLRKRVWPLVMMIERALQENKPVLWNVTF